MKLKIFFTTFVTLLILWILEFFWIIWHTSLFTYNYKIEWTDISHWQGKIDWKEVAEEEKYSLAYMKATEGHDYLDKTFEKNWKEARENNFYVGAYHFFSMRSAWKTQYEKIISVVPNEKDSLSLVIDVEIPTIHSKSKVEKELKFLVVQLEEYYWKNLFYMWHMIHIMLILNETF